MGDALDCPRTANDKFSPAVVIVGVGLVEGLAVPAACRSSDKRAFSGHVNKKSHVFGRPFGQWETSPDEAASSTDLFLA